MTDIIADYLLDTDRHAEPCRFGMPGCGVDHDAYDRLAGVPCDAVVGLFETRQEVVEVSVGRWLDTAGSVAVVIVGNCGRDADEMTPVTARRYAAAVLRAADLAEATTGV